MNIIFHYPKTEEGKKELQRRVNEQYMRMFKEELEKLPPDVQEIVIDERLKACR